MVTAANQCADFTPSGERPLQIAEEALVLAPALVYGHVQVEEDLDAQRRFELLTRFRSDLLRHRALLADDDRLLRLALDDDGRVYLDQLLVFFPPVDGHGGRVRQLLLRVREELLADELRGAEALRLRGVVLDRIRG